MPDIRRKGMFTRSNLIRAALTVVTLTALVVASTARASQLIDRNATGVTLAVTAKGEAMVTYTAGGKLKHVLAWGAVNAIPPSPSRTQVAFSLDYSGGYAKYHSDYWQTYTGVCLPYDGPPLAWEVAACKAPDGSYWALQAWQRGLPDYGVAPTATQAAWELRLSHWTGSSPVLQVQTDWSYRKYDHLFGTLSYGGIAEYGFRSTSVGAPLDTFGRNIYVDTYNSAYGRGWRRENSFLTHRPGGSFCYGFYPHAGRPAGNGERYRAIVQGPGVAPDVMWDGQSPGPFNATVNAAAKIQLRILDDPSCEAH
jgi:hypothetical protein